MNSEAAHTSTHPTQVRSIIISVWNVSRKAKVLNPIRSDSPESTAPKEETLIELVFINTPLSRRCHLSLFPEYHCNTELTVSVQENCGFLLSASQNIASMLSTPTGLMKRKMTE